MLNLLTETHPAIYFSIIQEPKFNIPILINNTQKLFNTAQQSSNAKFKPLITKFE